MDRASEFLTKAACPNDLSPAFLKVLDRHEDARQDSARWPDFLASLAALTGARRAGLFALSGRSRGEIWVPWRLDESTFDQWHGYFRHLDPWHAATRMPRRGEFCVVAGESMVSDEVIQGTEYFEKFLKPNDLRWMRAAWIRPDAAHASIYGVILFRGLSDAPFDPGVEQVLERVMRRIQLDERHAVANALGRATGLNGQDTAVFLLNASGALIMCNAIGETMLESKAVLNGSRCLGFSSAALSVWLDNAVRRTAGDDMPDEGVAQQRERLPGFGTAICELHPFRAIDSAVSLYGVHYALTIRRALARGTEAVQRNVQQTYHWTSAELDTVRRLAAGDDLPTIALSRSCAIETVRSHLKNAKRKARVRRQVDLVRMMISFDA